MRCHQQRSSTASIRYKEAPARQIDNNITRRRIKNIALCRRNPRYRLGLNRVCLPPAYRDIRKSQKSTYKRSKLRWQYCYSHYRRRGIRYVVSASGATTGIDIGKYQRRAVGKEFLRHIRQDKSCCRLYRTSATVGQNGGCSFTDNKTL